jgi:glycosyltransferase involved in cell wall biosynthesis
MKILRVIASVDPRSGGPIEGLKISASAMREMGHETEVVTLDNPSAAFLQDFPFPVYPCGPATRRYGYTPKLARWIVENGRSFDAAVVHGLWNHASIGGWLGLKKVGLPYVVFTHGMLDPWFREAYPLKHWVKQIFWSGWQGKVLRDAKTVLFTSEEERRLARGVFRGYEYREKVVAYAAAEPAGDVEQQTNAFAALMPALQDRRYLLFLSRIHPKKGCDLLVDAFVRLAARYPDVDLVIAGPDQVGLKATLIERAKAGGVENRIHWPGMLAGDAKWGAFRSAEAFILPSHQENFGIVVAEAMACATPVLITNKVNIWQEVVQSGGGFVEADDGAGVERLMQNWLGLSSEKRSTISASARQGFDRYFRPQSAALDLAAILHAASEGTT